MGWFCSTLADRFCRRTAGKGTILLWGILIGGLLGAVGPAQAEVFVTDISFTARSDGQGHVMRVHSTAPVEAYSMPQSTGQNRLKWVLYNAGLHEDYERGPLKGPVTRLTTERQNGHLILYLQLPDESSVRAEAYRDGASDDLLLNLAAAESRPVASASPSSSEPSASGPSASGPSASGPSSDVVHEAVSRGGVSQGARDRWKLDTVVIDPGHGGKDPGAQAHGLKEKDIVLKVAHKLGDYIENRLGIDVIYTRTDDRFIELEERGRMANEAGAKLFLSLHVNAARAAAARGTETYFLGRHKTEDARRVMERENSVIRYEDNPDRYDKYDEAVGQTLLQSSNMQYSQELASLVEKQFDERVKRRSRGVHQAGFYVLWSASMPSVLVELGFLTNSNEARFLNSDRGQTYLASALFRAVRNYKAQYEKGIVASE